MTKRLLAIVLVLLFGRPVSADDWWDWLRPDPMPWYVDEGLDAMDTPEPPPIPVLDEFEQSPDVPDWWLYYGEHVA